MIHDKLPVLKPSELKKMPKLYLFLLLILSLTLTKANVNSPPGQRNKLKSEDDDKQSSDNQDEQTIQIVMMSPDEEEQKSNEENDGEGLLDTGIPDNQQKGKFKFVLDKNIVFNAFQQQSPVDPIGATSGFRGTVGRRVTEVPGEWAYDDEEDGDTVDTDYSDERMEG